MAIDVQRTLLRQHFVSKRVEVLAEHGRVEVCVQNTIRIALTHSTSLPSAAKKTHKRC